MFLCQILLVKEKICPCELKNVTKSQKQISMAMMSEVQLTQLTFARVNRDLCRIHLTKFHDIGVENVTRVY